MPLEIRIVAQDDGRVTVNAPIEQKLVCLGLLRFAEHVVLSAKPAAIETGAPPLHALPKLRGE